MAATPVKTACWICGRPADSAEHAIKKTNIKRLFGAGPYPKGQRLVKKIEDGTKAFIQGPDSQHLKFEEVLCQSCNNAVTQPFDFAYDRFMTYVVAHSGQLLREREIDLRRVFGICGHRKRKHLFCYFIKAFGFRLASSGLVVPPDLPAALTGGPLPTSLLLTFSVFEELAAQDTQLRGIVVGRIQ